MKRREVQNYLQALADRYGLRWVEKSKHFVGLHRGIVIDASEWDAEITLHFSSPTAQLDDQFMEEFRGFTDFIEAGVPTEWIKGVLNRGGAEASGQSCRLTLDSGRIERLGTDVFNDLPALIGSGMHTHGAEETLQCERCIQKEAVMVGLLGGRCTPMCDDCWKDLQFQTLDGRLATEQKVNWPLMIPALIVVTAVGGYCWGWLQQPKQMQGLRGEAMLLPIIWALGLCNAIGRVCRGYTRTLRFALFASVITSVLAGNIWGYRSWLIQELEKRFPQPVNGPDWLASIQIYFQALPDIWQNEIQFLFGGILGAWFGMKILKGRETIDVR